MSQVAYHLWSNKHSAWWRPDARGYTTDPAEAGLYSEEDAVRYVVDSAASGLVSQVTCMVAAPSNWARPTGSRWRPIDSAGNVAAEPAPESPDEPDEGETGPEEVQG